MRNEYYMGTEPYFTLAAVNYGMTVSGYLNSSRERFVMFTDNVLLRDTNGMPRVFGSRDAALDEMRGWECINHVSIVDEWSFVNDNMPDECLKASLGVYDDRKTREAYETGYLHGYREGRIDGYNKGFSEGRDNASDYVYDDTDA